MTLTVWLSLLTASIVISLSPGAGAVNTMSNALRVGWRRSIWGIIGQQLALVLLIGIVAAGVGLLVVSSPALFTAIRLVGAAYLIYLGVRMIFAVPQSETVRLQAASETRRSLVFRGFWVNLLNPKAIVFFLAFIPQFIRADQPQAPQYLVLTATIVVVDVIVMWCFFAAAAKPFRRFSATPRGQRVLNRIFGALFVGVAALLLFVH